ncbi:MAG: hypothetical protein ABI678_02060, partial [Kofleriaceae bacterium]
RAKVRELDRRERRTAVEDMIRDVIASAPEAVKGTELDPVALRGRREKLIARAQELLPKAAPTPEAGVDLAAQLKQAMRSNAFGDLRFSGRDPVEVIDELRAQWADAGPLLDDADRAQAAEFEHVTQQVLDAAGAQAQAPREREERTDRGERRRRRERPSVETPVVTAAPIAAHDTPTAPAKVPFEPLPPPPLPAVAQPPAEVAMPRTKSVSTMPPMDDLDTAWDLGDDDPTAAKSEPEPQQTPSSSEMAGDGATGGDGIDEPGWD